MPKPCSDAWAAGMVDADGCITIKRSNREGKTYFHLAVIVSQAGVDLPPVIAKLHELYGGNVSKQHPQPGRRQPMWHWQVVGAAAGSVLKQIRPHLVGKTEQADVALAYRATVGPPGRKVGDEGRLRGEAAYAALRELKSYGKGGGVNGTTRPTPLRSP
jgi:hypothetical protein